MGSVEFHCVNKISYEAFDLSIRKWVGTKLWKTNLACNAGD